MLSRCNCVKLSPGQQLVSRNQPFTHFSGLFGKHLDPLHQLLRMCQKKVQIELAGRIEDLRRFFEMASFACIRSSLISCGEIKQEFGCSRRLSHLPLLLSNSP